MNKKLSILIICIIFLIIGLMFFLDSQLKYSRMAIMNESQFLDYFSDKIDTDLLTYNTRERTNGFYLCDTSKFLLKKLDEDDYVIGFNCNNFNILYGINLQDLANKQIIESVKLEPSGLMNNILFQFNKTSFYDKIEMSYMGKELPTYFDCKSKEVSCNSKECYKYYSDCKFSLEIKIVATVSGSKLIDNSATFYLKEPTKENLTSFLQTRSKDCGLEVNCTNLYCEYCGLLWGISEDSKFLGATSYQNLQSLEKLQELK